MSTSRIQLNRLLSLTASAIQGFQFTITNVKNGDFSVKALAKFADNSTLYVADAAGKVRVFKDVDDFIKAASKAGVINGATALEYTFDNLVAIEPKPYAGDLTKKAVSDIASLGKQIVQADLDITHLTTQIALFPANPTASEAAIKAEKQEQKDTVAELKAWLVAEKARIEAILAAQ